MRRAGALVLALAAGLFAAGLARDGFDRWVAATDLPPLAVETGTEVVDRAGRLLRAYTVADGRWRLAVTPEAVDSGYVAMLLAHEDRRFHDHAGVDPLALLRAGGQALRHGRVVSGGSTLTMQVARLLEESGTGRWGGKLRQIRVALALERRLTKRELLGFYLHLAPFGGNLEGVRAAALAWFGKEPGRLTPAEAALLVALPQAPVARRPDRHADSARAGRDRVLARAERAGLLDAAAIRAARAAPLPALRRPFPALAPHLADRLRAAEPGRARHATLLDAPLQAALEQLAAAAAARQGAEASAAILVMEHGTGTIRASVGSAGYLARRRDGFVDMTRAVRSPGSTLKPLVYGLAFDAGLAHPETLIDDRPARFGSYAPQNFDRRYHGTLRVRRALQMSLNLPVVRVAEALGPARLMAALRRAGATPVLEGRPGLAVALGGVGVTLEDLVRLYGAIARGGEAVAPRVRADAPAPGPTRRVLSPEAAWHLSDILAGIAPPGGGSPGIAYKTGTSYGHRDAWAIGFDGRHVVGVWIGRPDGTAAPGATGGGLAAPLLFEVFGHLGPAPVPLSPPPAATLTVPTARLPQPLRRFGGPGAGTGGPVIAFPPDGARLVAGAAPLVLRLTDGAPPFTVLADGRPVATGLHRRSAEIGAAGRGFLTLSVIDAAGRAAQSRIELR